MIYRIYGRSLALKAMLCSSKSVDEQNSWHKFVKYGMLSTLINKEECIHFNIIIHNLCQEIQQVIINALNKLSTSKYVSFFDIICSILKRMCVTKAPSFLSKFLQ